MSSVVIRAEGLSKCYNVRAVSLKRDLFGGAILDMALTAFSARQKRHDVVWALKDVSFQVNAGEAIGFVGANGAGKSTLLKILCRVTEPTSGEAEISGKLGSLLEVGAGFHPELTGRENVYLNGSILGMKQREINRRFDEIVDFSGIEKLIDKPVKYYSTGQYMRLGFAVAAHLGQDILIIDEVLAVGDAAYRTKCRGKMESLLYEGKTIIVVAHDAEFIERTCRRVGWLKNGMLQGFGEMASVLEAYKQESEANLAAAT